MALHDLSNGSNNIALGHTAGQYSTSGNRNVYISNGGPVESNTTRIGDANQAKTFISGIWNVVIGGGAQVVSTSSLYPCCSQRSRRSKRPSMTWPRGWRRSRQLSPGTNRRDAH